jgi:hypothetical protein
MISSALPAADLDLEIPAFALSGLGMTIAKFIPLLQNVEISWKSTVESARV